MLRATFVAAAAAVATTSAAVGGGGNNDFGIFFFDDSHEFPAQELRRYTHLLTNRSSPLLKMERVDDADVLRNRLAETKHAVVLFAPTSQAQNGGETKQQALADVLTAGGARASVQRHIDTTQSLAFAATSFEEHGFTLVTSSDTNATAAVNMQYGVYSVLEEWGARFDLHGDVLPDFSAPAPVAVSAPTFLDLVGRLHASGGNNNGDDHDDDGDADDDDKAAPFLASADPQFACVRACVRWLVGWLVDCCDCFAVMSACLPD